MSSGNGGPRKTADGQWADTVDVPPELYKWALTEAGAGVAAQVQSSSCVSELRFARHGSHIVAEIRARDRDAVRKAALVLRVHLENNRGLSKIHRDKERLLHEEELLEEEFNNGMRVEFNVPKEVLGLVIGKQGANIGES